VLLYQSLLMIVMQFLLLQLVVQYSPPIPKQGFWNWRNYFDYVRFITVFTLLLGLAHIVLGHSSLYIEILGTASLTVEATLPLPQAIVNYKNKSVAGFSLVVLGSWFIGDAFKTFYYLQSQAPLQFTLCGVFQLGMDCVIVGQWLTYRTYQPLDP
jgi:magnesium-transporting ATPase (P-type)